MKNIFIVMLLMMFTSCSPKVQTPDIQKYLKEDPNLILNYLSSVIGIGPNLIKIKTWELKVIHEPMNMPVGGTARNGIYWPIEIDINYETNYMVTKEYKETKKIAFYIDSYDKPILDNF